MAVWDIIYDGGGTSMSFGSPVPTVNYSDATDAAVADKVRVVRKLDASLHEPIRYPIAVMRTDSATAKAFEAYLESDEAAAVYRRAGFDPLIESH